MLLREDGCAANAQRTQADPNKQQLQGVARLRFENSQAQVTVNSAGSTHRMASDTVQRCKRYLGCLRLLLPFQVRIKDPSVAGHLCLSHACDNTEQAS